MLFCTNQNEQNDHWLVVELFFSRSLSAFSCEFCEISENTFLKEYLRATASRVTYKKTPTLKYNFS